MLEPGGYFGPRGRLNSRRIPARKNACQGPRGWECCASCVPTAPARHCGLTRSHRANPRPSSLPHLPPHRRLRPPSRGQTPSLRPTPPAAPRQRRAARVGAHAAAGGSRQGKALPALLPAAAAHVCFEARVLLPGHSGQRGCSLQGAVGWPRPQLPRSQPCVGQSPPAPPPAPHIPRSRGDCLPCGRQLGLKINVALPQLMRGAAGPGLRAAAGRQRWPWGPGAAQLPLHHPDEHQWPQGPGPASGPLPWLGADPAVCPALLSAALCPSQVTAWRC